MGLSSKGLFVLASKFQFFQYSHELIYLTNFELQKALDFNLQVIAVLLLLYHALCLSVRLSTLSISISFSMSISAKMKF